MSQLPIDGVASDSGLSPRDQRLVEILAVAHGPVRRVDVSTLLRMAGSKQSTKALEVLKAERMVEISSSGVCLAQGFAEPVVRGLNACGRFEQIASWVEEIDPAPRDRRDWHRCPVGPVLREMRRALYASDSRRFFELHDCWRRWGPTGDSLPRFSSWVLGPFEPEVLRRLPPRLAGFLLDDAVRRALDGCEPVEGLLPLTLELGKAEQGADAPELTLAWGRALLLAGRPAEAVERTDDLDSIEALSLRGDALLCCGKIKPAVAAYAKALAGVRQTYHEPAGLIGMSSLLQPLAYLLHGTASRRKQGRTIINRFLRRYDFAPATPYRGLWWLEHLGSQLSGDVAGEKPPSVEHPLALLMEGLVAFWDDTPAKQGRLTAAAERADACGFAWLAGELQALAAGDPALASGGATALMTHREPSPRWAMALEAIAVIAGGGGAKRVAGPRKPRVVWLLSQGDDWLELEPREQGPKGKSGWTKGRKIALSRLAEDPGSVEALAAEDLPLVKALSRLSSRGWGGYHEVEYSWPAAATWAALAGHPRVFDSADPTKRLDILSIRPQLVVRRNRGQLLLSMSPGPSERGGVSVRAVSGTRYEVVVFAGKQAEVAKVIGDGLSVPVAQADRVQALVGVLVPLFEVHDDAGVTRTSGRVVDTDSRPVVRLGPAGVGLRAAVIVRPLGPSGPSLTPGAGAEAVVDEVEGEARSTVRDLPAERRRADEVWAAAPTLASAVADGAERLVSDPQEALQVLEELHALGDAVALEWPEGESLRLRGSVGHGALSMSVRGGADDWFAVNGKLVVDEAMTLRLGALLELVRASSGRFIRLQDGAFLALTDQLRQHLDVLARVASKGGGKGKAGGDGARVHKLAGALICPLIDDAASRRTDAAWKAQLEAADAAADLMPQLPSTLQADLRPYQLDGFVWLARLAHWGAGACLADDMGLGKTIQALALLLSRASDGPALVVAPTSVCGNWIDEAWRFAPTLRTLRFGGGDRESMIAEAGPGDLLVCSYGLLQSEVERLSSRRWATVVLDEAQSIKNPATRRHKAALELSAACRVATTGTPIENHLGELWALFAFLNPGLLGSQNHFKTQFVAPAEAGDKEAHRQLKRLVAPFMLRRTKAAVLDDLPPRTEITVSVEQSPQEAAFYEALRRRSVAALESGGRTEAGPGAAPGDAGAPMRVLAEITRLRLACCNPALAWDEETSGAEPPPASSKLAAFGEIVETLRANRHRALVFSQFVRHLDLLRRWLDDREIPYQYLDGSTPAKERDRRVKAFQAGEGDLFLISLRAGGFGLNLTAADYVVHMDPWWNPAVEDQASDRAHRIGQRRPVTIYRLVTTGTIEEKILALHRRKRDLADQLLSGADASARMSAAELLALIRG